MFERFYIEISNICNLQCSFCPEVIRPKKILSIEDFRRIAEQVKPITKQVCLHLMGEPLAHPDFNKIAEICDELDLRVFLTTNGTLLHKHIELILNWKSLDQINFSVHSYFANPVKKDFNEYFYPILDFCERSISQNNNFYINLRLWNLPQNNVQISNNLMVLKTIENKFGVTINQNVDAKLNKSKKIKNKLYVHFDTEFTWPSLDQKNRGSAGSCYGLRKQAAIHANGDVVPCCLDKESILKLGNVLDTELSLQEILNSDRAKKISNGFARGELIEEMCQKCQYVDRFRN